MNRFEPWRAGDCAHLIDVLEWDLLLALADLKPGERVLETGCGQGRRLALLRQRGFSVTGLETEPDLVEEARRRLKTRHLVRPGRPEALPFEDNSFDLVIIHHLLGCCRDPERALAEAGRVALRRIVVETVNPISWLGLKARFGESTAGPSRWFGPWGLERLVERVLGPCPVEARSLLTFPQSWLPRLKRLEASPRLQSRLWGGLLFLAVDLRYTLRADSLAAPASLVASRPGGGVAPSRLTRSAEEKSHERGLPL